MTPKLARLLKAEADAEAALRVIREARKAEELKQSRALGYFVPLRGQQLLEAMSRSVA
jgi:hypothetical protein